jgi:gliding motility-associated-like protein
MAFGYLAPDNRAFYKNLDYETSNEEKNGPPRFKLDSISGDLVWNAPGMAGEYNVAFIVEEWRKINGEWKKLGYVTRDMQIIIEDSDNERPELIVPLDTCVLAGSPPLKVEIFGIDPEGEQVILEAFGGPFEFPGSAATYSPSPPQYQDSPGTLEFTWQTVCGHVRERPYEIQFKVTDTHPGPNQGPKLVDFKTWNVTVVAPAPTGLTATVEPGKVIDLAWDQYECGNAQAIEIWRRVDSYDFAPENCDVGMPDYAGYELIDVVDAGARSYSDDNKGERLDVGANYCYRLVAVFPLPEGGVSYASAEVCNIILADAPVITHVDIKTTSPESGQIEVKWRSPFEIDKVNFPPPYTYEVFRAEGYQGGTNLISLGTTQDTVITDTNLNTKDEVYNYRVHLVDGAGEVIDTSAVASTVRLEPKPLVQSIELSWYAIVPWSNDTQDYPIHYIYRNRVDATDPDLLVQIAQVNVNERGFYFWDDGSFNGVPLNENLEYCYYVTTQGSYGNPEIDEPLINNSQIICAQPNDRTPPCDPVSLVIDGNFTCDAVLASQSCDFSAFSNQITWVNDENEECEDDVRSYNIYFSETGAEGSFNLIDNVNTTSFRHLDIDSFKGCYKVSAVDRSGNESGLTEAICNDNCPYFELPNVFTPNGDGKNDVFRPFYDDGTITDFDRARCIRFVDKVVLTVFDRAGRAVYSLNSEDTEKSILIDWNGRTNDGAELPAGVYYYSADVTFDVLNPDEASKQYKGWVQLMR